MECFAASDVRHLHPMVSVQGITGANLVIGDWNFICYAFLKRAPSPRRVAEREDIRYALVGQPRFLPHFAVRRFPLL